MRTAFATENTENIEHSYRNSFNQKVLFPRRGKFKVTFGVEHNS